MHSPIIRYMELLFAFWQRVSPEARQNTVLQSEAYMIALSSDAPHRRMGVLRTRRQILDCRALLPLGHSVLANPPDWLRRLILRVDPVTLERTFRLS